MASDYKIDIDPDTGNFSEAFKDFFYHHFIDMRALSRREVDTAFYVTMTAEEKEIARRLIRQNLSLKYIHLIEAAGQFKDNLALPILYEQLETTADLSRQLTIGQAIWRINNDMVYQGLLRKLLVHPGHTTKEAHFEQVTDLKDAESIEMLFQYLNDTGSFVQHLALSKLIFLLTGQDSFETKFDKSYFQSRQNDRAFKQTLLDNLQKRC
jgi:hypothetical protein